MSENIFATSSNLVSIEFVCIIFKYTYTAAFIVWVLGSNLKVIIRNVISMCVKLSLSGVFTILQVSFSYLLLICFTGMCL